MVWYVNKCEQIKVIVQYVMTNVKKKRKKKKSYYSML